MQPTAEAGCADMRNPLSTIQRRIAAAAALVVAILLVVQVSSVGLEHTPWLIGVVVVAVLVAMGIAPASSPPKVLVTLSSNVKAKGDSNAPEIVPAVAYAAARRVFEAEFVPVAERANSNLIADKMTAAFVVHVRIQAVKLAWMATAMVVEAKHPGYSRSDSFKGYRLLGEQQLGTLLQQLPMISGETKSLEFASKDIECCEAALEVAVRAVVDDSPQPMNALYELIEREFPYSTTVRAHIADPAVRLDAAYGGPFRRAIAAAETASA
jgi:hypothetical protein